MPTQNERLNEIRDIAIAAKAAGTTHELVCDKRWAKNDAMLEGIQATVQKVLLATAPPRPDPWRDYWRMTTIGLIGTVGFLIVLIGGGAWSSLSTSIESVRSNLTTSIESVARAQAAMLTTQAGMAAQITAIDERGRQNREDVLEIRKDVKETKSDLKDANAKVQESHEAIARLEAKTP